MGNSASHPLEIATQNLYQVLCPTLCLDMQIFSRRAPGPLNLRFFAVRHLCESRIKKVFVSSSPWQAAHNSDGVVVISALSSLLPVPLLLLQVWD